MKIGILGTGEVGLALAGRFAELGHDVMIGTRDVEATRERKADWYSSHSVIGLGTQAQAAAHGDVVVNATSGGASLAALTLAGAQNLAGKVLIDVSNPLDFSQGFPPTLLVKDTDSLAEQIQREFPSARVVKTLNTVSNPVMIHPERIGGGDHTMFVAGNDEQAKADVTGLLRELGWQDIIDLGDITGARGMEMYLPLWVRLYGVLGNGIVNVKLVR